MPSRCITKWRVSVTNFRHVETPPNALVVKPLGSFLVCVLHIQLTTGTVLHQRCNSRNLQFVHALIHKRFNLHYWMQVWCLDIQAFWWEFELCPWISQMIHFLRIGFLSPAWQRQAVLWIRGSRFHDPDFWLKCPVWKSLRSLPAILSWGERWNHTFSWLSAVGLQSTFSSDSAYLVFEPLAAVKSASLA